MHISDVEINVRVIVMCLFGSQCEATPGILSCATPDEQLSFKSVVWLEWILNLCRLVPV